MKSVKEFISENRLKQLTTGPSRSSIGLYRQRKDASERAAFRRAGMRRTQSGGVRQKFSSTGNQNEYSKTAITSYPSQSAYAKDSVPEKENNRSGVISTRERALYLKRLKRQLRTTRTRRGVHAVDILPRGDYKKNDPKDLHARGREFHRVVREVPQEVIKSGGKKGDKIIGKASEVMPGSKNPEQGRKKRRELYSKTIGATKWDPITKVQVAKVSEELKIFLDFVEDGKDYGVNLDKRTGKMVGKVRTFEQFLKEAKEARPPREVLNKIERAYARKHRGVNVDTSHHEKSNTIRLNNIWIPPDKRNQGIGGRIMKGLTKYADKQRQRITLIQEPEKGKKAKLQKFYKSHGFESNKGRNRDFTTKDTHIRNPKE